MNPNLAALIGTPYVWGGDDPRRGFDCWRLLIWARREIYGLETPHVLEGLEIDTNEGRMAAHEASRALPGWVEVPLAEGREADVALLSMRADGRPHHCGIVAEAGAAWVVHAFAPMFGGPGQVYCTAREPLRRAFQTMTVHTWRS